MTMTLGSFTFDAPVFLAPMAGVTDTAYRVIAHDMGCPLCYAEMVSSQGIHYRNEHTLAMLQSEPESKPVAAPGPDEKTQNMKEAGTTGRERANAGKTQPAAGNAADVLPPEQKEELQKRVGIIRHRLLEMMESLLSQHIADQIEQRTDEKAAQEAFQQNGYLPLYVDEKAMGIVYNTLTVQLLLDRFNLLFEGVFAPVDQETVNSVMVNVLAPYWKQNAQSILFTMEE